MNRIYKKITIIALSLIAFVSFAFVTKADTQTENSIKVFISSRYGYETIHAQYGDRDYLFYTFDKVTSKVPAPNKWYRVPSRGIDINLVKSAKNIYFANSTIPSVDEVVKVTIPPQPKLSKASYDVWADKLTVLSGTKDVTDRASVNGILTNSSTFATTFADIIEEAKCNNGNISVSLGAVNSAGKAVDRVELDFSYNNASGFYEIGNVQSRSLCGTYKTVKVLKRPAAPVVTVDYNNHFFKVAGNVEVTKVASKTTAPVYEEGKGLLKGVTKGKFTYYFVGDETGYYCTRTKEERGKKLASLDSEFEISAMPDCKSKVSVIGRNNEDASRLTLVINSGFVSDSGYSKTMNLVGDLKTPEVKSKTPTASWKAASDKKSATVTMKVTFTEKLAKEEDGEYVLLTSGTDLKNWFAIDKDAYTLDSAIYTSGGTPYITFKFTYDLTKAASEARNVGMVSGKKLYDKVGYELTWPGIVVKADSKMVQWK